VEIETNFDIQPDFFIRENKTNTQKANGQQSGHSLYSLYSVDEKCSKWDSLASVFAVTQNQNRTFSPLSVKACTKPPTFITASP